MTKPAHLSGGPQPEPRHSTINTALREAASSNASILLVDADEKETPISMGELYQGARRIAAALLERKLQSGDRVALVLPTGRDFLEAFFGVQLAGAVPVPLYPPVRLGRMDDYLRSTTRMLTAVQASMVLTDRRVKLLLGKVIETARPSLGCPTVQDLRGSRNEAEIATNSAALGVIQFSSGSTVDPKPVALSHANLVAQCASLRALLTQHDASAPPMGVSWLPLYHDMGLIGCLLSAVTFPGSLALIAPEVFLARPALWLRAISRYRGTISPAPNFAYGLCLKRIKDQDLDGVDLSSWSYALNGAEPVSADVMARFSDRFSNHGFRREALMPVYGMSEASLAVTFSSARGEKRVMRSEQNRDRTIVSVGTPVPGAEIEIRGDDGALCNEGEIGRIWARGGSIMVGYFSQPEATEAALQEGWLDTGDLGFVDAGELFVSGRAKDVVIIRGANHAPQEFEECLEAIEGVRTGCAVAFGVVPDGADDEQLVVLAETSGRMSHKSPTGDEPLERQISAAIVGRTGVRPYTVQLLSPGTLPRTSSGKLRRAEARLRFLSSTLTAPDTVNALSMTKWVASSAMGFAKARLG